MPKPWLTLRCGDSDEIGESSSQKKARGSFDQMDPELWSGLPLEIVEQVLSFLPLTDLCRYNIVCKAWNQIIGNPEFGAVHALNMAKQGASFIVMHYLDRTVEDRVQYGSTHEAWYFLELNTRRWYSCNTVIDPIKDFSNGVVAMDGGLVCQNMKSMYNSIIVHNPLGDSVIPLPPVRAHRTSQSFPQLDIVVDSISLNYKIILINHCFTDIRDPRLTAEERLSIPKDPLLRIYDSDTQKWRDSIRNPSCLPFCGVGWVGHASKVEFQGLFYILLGDRADSFPLWTYNLVEDVWVNVPVLIPSRNRLTHPELVVCANRLFLIGWFWKHMIIWRGPDAPVLNLDTGKNIYFEVFEIGVPDMTRETVAVFSKSSMVKIFDIKTGCEDSGFVHPRISVIGFGKSLLFMSNSSGKSVSFDVVTREWDVEWPQNPLGYLPDENSIWVGKHMNLLLPTITGRHPRRKKLIRKY